MAQNITDQLLYVWRRLPRTAHSLVPCRNDFRLTEISDILPRLILMQWQGPYDVTVSLVGTMVQSLWDRPITGMNAFDLTGPAMRDNASRLYQAILRTPSGAMVEERLRRLRRRPLHITSLYLPLANEEGEPVYIVGCCVAAEEAQTPVFKDHVVTNHRQLAGLRFLDIGAGKPEPIFDMPSVHSLHPAADVSYEEGRGWWHRLLHGRDRPERSTRPSSKRESRGDDGERPTQN